MNLDFKEKVWKAQFTPTEDSAEFESRLRSAYGLATRYESAQLLIGRSLAERTPPDPLPAATKYLKTPISGEVIFGEDLDTWLSALVLDGRLNPSSTVDDFRTLVEAHWARGYSLIRDELEHCERNHVRLATRLADHLPEESGPAIPFGSGSGQKGEIRLKLGPVSKTYPGSKPFDFVLNAQGAPPHIAFMGSSGGNGFLTIFDFEPVALITFSASSRIVNSTGFPILTGPVNSSGVAIIFSNPSTRSSTYWKLRV